MLDDVILRRHFMTLLFLLLRKQLRSYYVQKNDEMCSKYEYYKFLKSHEILRIPHNNKWEEYFKMMVFILYNCKDYNELH